MLLQVAQRQVDPQSSASLRPIARGLHSLEVSSCGGTLKTHDDTNSQVPRLGSGIDPTEAAERLHYIFPLAVVRHGHDDMTASLQRSARTGDGTEFRKVHGRTCTSAMPCSMAALPCGCMLPPSGPPLQQRCKCAQHMSTGLHRTAHHGATGLALACRCLRRC